MITPRAFKSRSIAAALLPTRMYASWTWRCAGVA
jgi:hypothetical protein